ncbi:unnamed protein product [Adineta ricciae]|uniref:TIR domain-containing protein n=1 Tax=Adineta ricciae TaxID=249248 RepID=A0A816DV87_ADIRI|nr:unnamed protein product [Adineta ricciae]CAF1643919.1 unnamed protein product [Adineta ricciae]
MSEEFQQIHDLYEKLHEILRTNQSFALHDVLTDISRLATHLSLVFSSIPIDTVDIFEYILKSCLELLDTTEFIDIIVQHHSVLWTSFNGSLCKSLTHIYGSDIIDRMTISARQQMSYRLLDQLKLSKSLEAFLQTSVYSRLTFSEQKTRSFVGCILILILRQLRVLKTNSIDLELDKYQTNLFPRLFHFLNDYFVTNERSQMDLLIHEILSFFVVISCSTKTIPILIQIDCPQLCLQWLTLPYLSLDEYKFTLGIICNIARHDDGAAILRYHKCRQILNQFRNEISGQILAFILDNEQNEYFTLTSFITMVLCYQSNELNNDSIRAFINDYLIDAILRTIYNGKLRYLGFHLVEFWIVVMKLCRDDYYMNCILENEKHIKMLQLITGNFLYYSDLTRINDLSNRLTLMAVINILWSISFHPRYRKDLLEDLIVIERLETIRLNDQLDKVVLFDYTPRHMYSLKRAADGVLHNLGSKTSIPIPPCFPPKNSVFSLRISYSHDDMHFCRELYDVLVKLPQLSISIDFQNGKYLWNEVAQTIQQCHLVLLLVSPSFYQSLSCRQEFIYATSTLKKSFIPILIDADYEAKGWLETRVKHICFGREDFQTNCNQLLSLIGEQLSIELPSVSSLRNSKNIQQWNSSDVQQWFENHGIKSELYEFYQFKSGHELFLYAQAMSGYQWTKEYERIRLRFEGKFQEQQQHLSSYEFLKFINALEHLINKC